MLAKMNLRLERPEAILSEHVHMIILLLRNGVTHVVE